MTSERQVIFVVLAAVVLLSSGCVHKQVMLTQKDIDAIPAYHAIKLTRIPQNDDYSCATTSLAMIISYYQNLAEPLDKEYIWNLSGTDISRVRKYGNDISGLNAVAKKYQYAYSFEQNMTYDKLRYYISKNMPVIVFINFDERHTHATLLTGYDKGKKIYFMTDPSSDETIMRESFLDNHWTAWLSNPRTDSFRAGYVLYKN